MEFKFPAELTLSPLSRPRVVCACIQIGLFVSVRLDLLLSKRSLILSRKGIVGTIMGLLFLFQGFLFQIQGLYQPVDGLGSRSQTNQSWIVSSTSQ